jgi:hypothetical protein
MVPNQMHCRPFDKCFFICGIWFGTVRQVQFDMAKLFVLLMMLVARLSSMERLLLELPNVLQRMLAEQFGTLQR